jgi:hypothetical protein
VGGRDEEREGETERGREGRREGVKECERERTSALTIAVVKGRGVFSVSFAFFKVCYRSLLTLSKETYTMSKETYIYCQKRPICRPSKRRKRPRI